MDILSYILGKKAGGGGSAPVLIDKSITENGVYNASADEADGYKTVTANVRGYDFFDSTKPEGDVITEVTNIKPYAAYARSGIKSVTGVNVTRIEQNAFQNSSVEYVSFPNLQNAGSDANIFQNSKLKKAFFPKTTRFNHHAFSACNALEEIVMPKLTQTPGNSFANDCYNLQKIDFGEDMTNIPGASDFYNARKLAVLVLRSKTVVALANVGTFTNSSIRGYGGTYSGHVYVPSALIDSYKNASNWSVLYGDYADIFRSIEGSIYETQYADGTPIS